MVMRTWDKMLRESVKRTPEQEKNMTATLTVGELEIMKEDMKQLTKSYYEALTRIKELVEEVEQLKNEVESLKGDKVELRSIRGH
jgi:FtsZ-binding cell division protein ZapB